MLSDSKIPLETLLLASICDGISFLAWTKTKEAQKGQKRPKSILNAIIDSKKETDLEVFEDGKDFNHKWLDLTRSI